MIEVKRTERGWGGHFVCGFRCKFRRNTLLEHHDCRIVISTVGMFFEKENDEQATTLGQDRYYETEAFVAYLAHGHYWDADVSERVAFSSPWKLCWPSWDAIPEGCDNLANDMHEAVVNEIEEMIRKGLI